MSSHYELWPTLRWRLFRFALEPRVNSLHSILNKFGTVNDCRVPLASTNMGAIWSRSRDTNRPPLHMREVSMLRCTRSIVWLPCCPTLIYFFCLNHHVLRALSMSAQSFSSSGHTWSRAASFARSFPQREFGEISFGSSASRMHP